MRRIAIAIIAASAFAGASPVEGQVQNAPPTAQAPASPASDQVKALIAAARMRDDAGFLAFAEENLAMPGFTRDALLDLKQRVTRWQVRSVVSATPIQAELLAFHPLMDDWMRISVTVQPGPPHKIVLLSNRFGQRPADVQPPPKLAPQELAAAVRAKVAERAAQGLFDGVVLVAQDGKPVVRASAGLADLDRKAPDTADTQFRFGSMGKMFTAVAIMQLVQAGKVELKAPVGRYLKDYPNADIATKVTVDNLLTHTGGTGDIFGPVRDAHRDSLLDAKDYVALFGARAPMFAPGAREAYSNYGFILLGRIVEEASGEAYDDYVQRHIFGPAGMQATGNLPESIRLPHRAVSYMGFSRPLASAAATLPLRGTPAGGGYSTAGDLLRFANALMRGRLLDAEHTRLLTEGGATLQDGKFHRYDFGGTLPTGEKYVGHSGGAPGMNGELRIFPQNGYTVVVLANRDPPLATALANFVTERLPAPPQRLQ